MSMSIGQYQYMAIPCPACGKTECGHDCPGLRLKNLRDCQKRLICPVCPENAVDINTSDYYECRKCHTQFSTGFADSENPERTFLDDPKCDDLIQVSILKKKGREKIRMDEAVELAQKKYNDAIKKEKSAS